MELEEFIKKTLVSIANGLRGANQEIQKIRNNDVLMFDIVPHNDDKVRGYINFDIAIAANAETTTSGNGGIKVASIGIEGNINDKTQQSQFSRIQFHVLPWSHIN